MSIFHCQAKAISRAAERSATAAAAYRAGERIIDERAGEIQISAQTLDSPLLAVV
ncbi:MAG: hypothetical protein LBU64_09610 [Planctomycetota bacterium]|nr:hypothetical protein [Planctomycetota bacterium]